MKTLRFLPTLLGLCSLFLFSCGSDNANKSDENTATSQEDATTNTGNPANMQDAMKMAEKQIQDLQGENANVTPVNFRKLKELLPERLLNMPRTKHSGQNAGAMNMKFSQAEAEYRDGDKRLTVNLIDAGGVGMVTLGMANWTTYEIDKEDEEGHERTYNWKNFKVYEKCRPADKFCSFMVYHEKGIIAELKGYSIPVSDLKSVAEQLNISSIPGMRE